MLEIKTKLNLNDEAFINIYGIKNNEKKWFVQEDGVKIESIKIKFLDINNVRVKYKIIGGSEKSEDHIFKTKEFAQYACNLLNNASTTKKELNKLHYAKHCNLLQIKNLFNIGDKVSVLNRNKVGTQKNKLSVKDNGTITEIRINVSPNNTTIKYKILIQAKKGVEKSVHRYENMILRG